MQMIFYKFTPEYDRILKIEPHKDMNSDTTPHGDRSPPNEL